MTYLAHVGETGEPVLNVQVKDGLALRLWGVEGGGGQRKATKLTKNPIGSVCIVGVAPAAIFAPQRTSRALKGSQVVLLYV